MCTDKVLVPADLRPRFGRIGRDRINQMQLIPDEIEQNTSPHKTRKDLSPRDFAHSAAGMIVSRIR